MFPEGFCSKGDKLFKWAGVIQRDNISTLFSDGELSKETINNLNHFCFPTDSQIPNATSFVFRFMATNEKFYNAFCFADHDMSQDNQQVLCFISNYYHFDVFDEALKITRNLLTNNLPSAVQFLHLLHEEPETITYMSSLKTIWGRGKIDEIYNNQKLLPIIKRFDSTTIATLIYYLLLDTPIIVTSSDLSELSQFCYSLTSIIYPLKWHHIFVPVLPNSIIETVLSPSPFIVGIHSSLMKNLPKDGIESHLLIDIDNEKIECVDLTNPPAWISQVSNSFCNVSLKSLQSNVLTKYLHQLILQYIFVAIGMHPSGSPYLIARKILAAAEEQKLNDDSISSMMINSRTVKCLLNTIKENPIPNTYMSMLSCFSKTFVSFPASQNVEEFPLKKIQIAKSVSVQFPVKKREPHKSKSLSELSNR